MLFKGRADESGCVSRFILNSIYLLFYAVFVFFFFIFPLMFAEEDLPIKSGVASHPPRFRLISCFWCHSCSFETLIDPVLHLKKYIRGKETSTESTSLPACHFFLQKVFQRASSTWMSFLARRPLNSSEVRVQRRRRPSSGDRAVCTAGWWTQSALFGFGLIK